MVGSVSPSLAQGQGQAKDEKALWGFAEVLFRQGEYYRAVSEYRRGVHYFPKSAQVQQAQLRIGQALILGGEVGEALRHLDQLLLDNPSKAFGDEVRFLRGVAWLEYEAQRPYPLRRGNIEKALKDFGGITPNWRGGKYIQGFQQAIQAPPDLPEKSPWLAGGMSALLPGAGSFYVGRYAEGALTLFVNSLLFYATAGAIQREREGLALVMGSLSLAFYAGGIYAASNGAHKFNDRQQATYLDQQRHRFGVMVNQGGLSGVFETKF